VVRYINKATGSLVLQVPSDQVLSVARGIYEELQRETQARETANVNGDRGQGHGH